MLSVFFNTSKSESEACTRPYPTKLAGAGSLAVRPKAGRDGDSFLNSPPACVSIVLFLLSISLCTVGPTNARPGKRLGMNGFSFEESAPGLLAVLVAEGDTLGFKRSGESERVSLPDRAVPVGRFFSASLLDLCSCDGPVSFMESVRISLAKFAQGSPSPFFGPDVRLLYVVSPWAKCDASACAPVASDADLRCSSPLINFILVIFAHVLSPHATQPTKCLQGGNHAKREVFRGRCESLDDNLIVCTPVFTQCSQNGLETQAKKLGTSTLIDGLETQFARQCSQSVPKTVWKPRQKSLGTSTLIYGLETRAKKLGFPN